VKEETKKPLETSRIEPAVHEGYWCDGCDARPIKGIRYRCTVCHNFDFCEKCEVNIEHPHPFLKIKQPQVLTYTCDGCGVHPIRGTRYRCTACPNFDFCEGCETNTEHPHAFIKIKQPQNPQRPPNNEPQKAPNDNEMVQNITKLVLQ